MDDLGTLERSGWDLGEIYHVGPTNSGTFCCEFQTYKARTRTTLVWDHWTKMEGQTLKIEVSCVLGRYNIICLCKVTSNPIILFGVFTFQNKPSFATQVCRHKYIYIDIFTYIFIFQWFQKRVPKGPIFWQHHFGVPAICGFLLTLWCQAL